MKKAMMKGYGAKKGEEVYYATENKKKGGKPAKRKILKGKI